MKLQTIDLLSATKLLKLSEVHQTPLECKFILISSSTTYYLVFGALHTYNYHAQLLEKFCQDYNIESKWQKHPDQYKLLDSKYHMKGGGWFHFDFGEKILTVKGISTAYGRFDEFIISEFSKKNQIFRDFKIKILS